MRTISASSGVPIEPPEQTRLLDATMQQRGVLMAVVPGAGGADAVLALVLPSATVQGLLATRQRVGALWRCWADEEGDGPEGAKPRTAVCGLPVVESKASAGGHNGVQLEGAEVAERLRAAAEPLRAQLTASGRRLGAPAALALAVIGVAAAAAVALARRQR